MDEIEGRHGKEKILLHASPAQLPTIHGAIAYIERSENGSMMAYIRCGRLEAEVQFVAECLGSYWVNPAYDRDQMGSETAMYDKYCRLHLLGYAGNAL